MYQNLTWHLPQIYNNEAIRSRISWDGQVYFACENCGWEHRIDPAWISSGVGSFENSDCDSCSAEGLDLVRHLDQRTSFCKDCEQTSRHSLTLFDTPRCLHCLSANLSVLSSEILPPFTGRFGQFLIQKEYPWGENGSDDGKIILQENMSVNVFPDFPFYLLTAAAFARRLRLYGDYESDEHVALILNMEANLFRDYFRRSEDLPAGIEALELFEDCVRITAEPLQKALIEHNVAMAIYSMLAKFPEEIVCVLTLRPNLRFEGIAAAKRALSVFSRFDDAPLKTQSARVEFLIGDLLKVGNSSQDERKESILHYDKALNSGALPENMQLHVRESRGITLSGIKNISPELLAKAINDLNQVVTKSEADRVWSDKYAPLLVLARLHLRQNNLKKATELMEHAAALAARELEIINDEVTLFQKGNIHAPIFEELAGCYAKAERAEEALMALETVRSPTLRLHTMNSVELARVKQEKGKSSISRVVKIMFGTEKAVELHKLQLQPVRSHIDQISRVLSSVPTAFISFMLREDQVTAVIVLLTEHATQQIHSVQF